MRLPPLALLLVAASLLQPLPATARILAEGAARNGYYRQKVQQKSGKVVYICRSTSDAKFQKHDNCNNAGAPKP